MKRGWITWDKSELPAEAFTTRLNVVSGYLAERELPALVVYSDIWRSNHGRYFSNFMPYWNRALLVLVRDGPPVLLCALSPRVYPWIRSVTILDDIRPSPNLAQQLLKMCAEKNWKRMGVLDLAGLPQDLHSSLTAGAVALGDVPVAAVRRPDDPWELAMYRRAARLAREVLSEELPHGIGAMDYEFAGRLERRFRRAGAEDLIILLTSGKTAPAPAKGAVLDPDFSVALALEYRGHWVKLARSASLAEPEPRSDTPPYVENLGGPSPYEVGAGPVYALCSEVTKNNRRLFHGDSYWRGPNGDELL